MLVTVIDHVGSFPFSPCPSHKSIYSPAPPALMASDAIYAALPFYLRGGAREDDPDTHQGHGGEGVLTYGKGRWGGGGNLGLLGGRHH